MKQLKSKAIVVLISTIVFIILINMIPSLTLLQGFLLGALNGAVHVVWFFVWVLLSDYHNEV